MKSIREKSGEYGYTNWQSEEYHDGASEGLPFDAIGHTQKTFEAGANYVLECFESILPFVAKKGIIYWKIKETIEQLKK